MDILDLFQIVENFLFNVDFFYCFKFKSESIMYNYRDREDMAMLCILTAGEFCLLPGHRLQLCTSTCNLQILLYLNTFELYGNIMFIKPLNLVCMQYSQVCKLFLLVSVLYIADVLDVAVRHIE